MSYWGSGLFWPVVQSLLGEMLCENFSVLDISSWRFPGGLLDDLLLCQLDSCWPSSFDSVLFLQLALQVLPYLFCSHSSSCPMFPCILRILNFFLLSHKSVAYGFTVEYVPYMRSSFVFILYLFTEVAKASTLLHTHICSAFSSGSLKLFMKVLCSYSGWSGHKSP